MEPTQTQDVINVCQPCFELAQTFGIVEWMGIGVLGVITIVGFFTKKNFFTFAGGAWNFTKTIYGFFKKDDKAIK